MTLPRLLVVDGRVAGTWRARRAAGRLGLTVEPFGGLPAGTRPGLEAEAAGDRKSVV